MEVNPHYHDWRLIDMSGVKTSKSVFWCPRCGSVQVVIDPNEGERVLVYNYSIGSKEPVMTIEKVVWE